jgi:DNA-binding beta-propeller fold protein YncE
MLAADGGRAADARAADARAAESPPAVDSGPPVGDEELRKVLLVGNSVAGTVSFLDAESFASLGSVNVLPDRDEVLAAINADLVRGVAYPIVKSQQLLHHFEPADGDRFVDDVFLSPDGTTLYVSRSNLGDVAAFDLTKPKQPLKWKSWVDGLKADHATISHDGSRLVVSATTARVADVFDATTGKIVGSFATGYYPHQNDYSADGKYIYNSSIGNVGFEAVPYELNALKGDRWLVKADATTLAVVHTWHFEYGIRPSVITADDTIMYAQLSYLNGVIKYDLQAEKELARSDQPLSAFAMQTYKTHTEYPHDSAHHGLALSGDGKRLCDCGTVDNTVTIVSTETMKTEKTIDVGLVPYWATTSPNGRYCFVSLSGDNAVAVIDYEQAKQVAVVPVGKFPQRSRLGSVPETVVGLLSPSGG